jgi:hypothetical protein
MHLEKQTNVHLENTPLSKKDVLCVYIKSIYNKGREKKEKTVGEWIEDVYI